MSLVLVSLYALSPHVEEIPSIPIAIRLNLSKPPALGEVVDLVAEARSVWNVSGVIINITMSEGIGLVSGTPSWEGTLTEGQTLVLHLSVSPTRLGLSTVLGEARCGLACTESDAYYVASDTLYLDVGTDRTIVSHLPPVTSEQTARTATEQG